MASIIKKGINFLDGKDSYDLNVTTSIQKAITNQEAPTKIKHVRSVIISTHHEQGGSTFWATVSKLPLQSQGASCWKFCHTLHKLMRDGHPNVVFDSMKYLTWMMDLGRVWSHLPENFGPLNSHYLKLLTSRLRFHKKHIKVRGNLEISEELMAEETGNEANGYFEFGVELLDLMDDVLNLQSMVFHQLERNHDTSMTPTGQCKLYPLIICIQDSCQLYDYLVKVLFKLHRAIPTDALSGHRERFLQQYKSIKAFYQTCSNLQYYRGLIQIPTLPDTPPNFLIASELSKHKKPVAIVAGEEPDEEESPPPRPAPPPVQVPKVPPSKPLIEPAVTPVQPVPDVRDTVISQLRTQVEHLRNELEFIKTKAREKVAELNAQIETLKNQVETQKKELDAANSTVAAMKRRVDEQNREIEELRENLAAADKNAAAMATLSKAEEQAKSSDERFKKMREVYEKLKQEHVTLLRTNAQLKKEAAAEKQVHEEQQKLHQESKSHLDRLILEKKVIEESVQRSSAEQTAHTAQLQERIEELDRQRQEYEEKLVISEMEKEGFQRQLQQYESTADNLEQSLKVEQQERQQAAAAAEASVTSLRAELEALQLDLSALHQTNQDLLVKLNKASEDHSSNKKEFSDTMESLKSKLSGVEKERDNALHERLALREALERESSRLAEESLQRQRDGEQKLSAALAASLANAVQQGITEVTFTLEHIASEEFVSHTCSADAAVRDLRTLDTDLENLTSTIQDPADQLKLSASIHLLTHRLCRTLEEAKAACNRAPPEQGDVLADKCGDLGREAIGLYSSIEREYTEPNPDRSALATQVGALREHVSTMLLVARALVPQDSDISSDKIEELVDEEMNATQQAIQEAADKIQEMLEKARKRDTGVKLEVNEKILDSVTGLMAEIHKLVRKSKDLQAEIVSQGRGSSSVKEFYKKNHRWTEGLVSAAKAVGWGAKTLVERAERIMEGKGTLNELKVCSNEIAASTAQLVVSSQVKADKESRKLADLKLAAKSVKNATADVVASSNFGQQMIEDADLLDFSDLSLTQTKRAEMNTQVHILELESNMVKERKKLAEIRKRHYQLAGESEGWETNGS